MTPDDHKLFDDPEPKNGWLIKALVAGGLTLAVGAAGATVALPALSESVEAAVEMAAEDAVEAESVAAAPEPQSKKKKKKGKATVDLIDLEPMVVSILPGQAMRGAAPRLRMRVSLELDSGLYSDGTRQRVRHAFISAIQEVDTDTLNAPGGIDALRMTLRDAAAGALGEGVRDVFITEFILL
ncbi:MAG: flagellar basal body-associated FliL family protein [Pseudomonadota bacterium]